MSTPDSTEARRRAFLEAYARCGNVTLAADKIKLDRSRHYVWMREPAYREAFQVAGERAVEALLGEARRRAFQGYEDPVIYQGELQYRRDKQGKKTSKPLTVTRYSDNLLMFLIKGLRPEYRDTFKADITHTHDTRVTNTEINLTILSDDTLEQLRAALRPALEPLGGEGPYLVPDARCGAGGDRAPGEEQDLALLPGDGPTAA